MAKTQEVEELDLEGLDEELGGLDLDEDLGAELEGGSEDGDVPSVDESDVIPEPEPEKEDAPARRPGRPRGSRNKPQESTPPEAHAPQKPQGPMLEPSDAVALLRSAIALRRNRVTDPAALAELDWCERFVDLLLN